jgi:hypothetical protein
MHKIWFWFTLSQVFHSLLLRSALKKDLIVTSPWPPDTPTDAQGEPRPPGTTTAKWICSEGVAMNANRERTIECLEHQADYHDAKAEVCKPGSAGALNERREAMRCRRAANDLRELSALSDLIEKGEFKSEEAIVRPPRPSTFESRTGSIDRRNPPLVPPDPLERQLGVVVQSR